MIHSLSNSIVTYLASLGIIKNEKEIYAYGFELVISFFINVLISIIIGMIFSCLIEVIIFLLSFIILRSYTGGYHANTHLKCTVCMVIAILILVLNLRYQLPILVLGTLSVLSILFISIICPIENVNKIIDVSDYPEFKRKAIVISFLLLCVAFLLKNIAFTCSISLTYSIIIVSISALIEEVRK